MSQQLSQHDAAVLEYLFNPLMQSPDQANCYLIPDIKENEKEEDANKLDNHLLAQIKQLEVSGIHAARSCNYKESIKLFSEAISLAPNYSSPYNNRAQVYRILKEYQLSLNDLNKAIEISDPLGNVNPINTRVARLAYAQRGFLLKGFMDNESHGQKDLQNASLLGHNLASLETNPFRTLCGEMVSVMMKEQCGISDD